jgi:hypothetical protein
MIDLGFVDAAVTPLGRDGGLDVVDDGAAHKSKHTYDQSAPLTYNNFST